MTIIIDRSQLDLSADKIAITVDEHLDMVITPLTPQLAMAGENIILRLRETIFSQTYVADDLLNRGAVIKPLAETQAAEVTTPEEIVWPSGATRVQIGDRLRWHKDKAPSWTVESIEPPTGRSKFPVAMLREDGIGGILRSASCAPNMRRYWK